MQALRGKFCRGCGTSIANLKNYERRVLCSESATKVKSAWEEIIQFKLRTSSVIVSVQDMTGSLANPQYICRKCFMTYERYLAIREEILDNVEMAIPKLLAHSESEDVPPMLGEKRTRCDDDNEKGPPPSKRLHFGPTASNSPAVVVRTALDLHANV